MNIKPIYDQFAINLQLQTVQSAHILVVKLLLASIFFEWLVDRVWGCLMTTTITSTTLGFSQMFEKSFNIN
jgi:hypothetical protein